MSVYNEPERFLRESIDSILQQTYRNFEFIIILDNPDNHEALRVLQDYAQQDPRIRLYQNPRNLGLAMSLNRGIQLAQCDIIARMDADDVALPERLEKELNFMKEHPQYRLISPNRIGIDEDGNQNRPPFLLPKDFDNIKDKENYMDMVPHSGITYYTEDLRLIGGYRNFPAAQDRDLWLRYLSRGWQVGFMDECLIKYRMSTDNTTMGNSLRQWICVKYALKLYRERTRKGNDSYSDAALQQLLIKAGCNNARSKEQFNKGRKLLFEGGTAMREHRYLRTAFNLLRSIFLHKEMPSHVSYVIQARYRNAVTIPRLNRKANARSAK